MGKNSGTPNHRETIGRTNEFLVAGPKAYRSACALRGFRATPYASPKKQQMEVLDRGMENMGRNNNGLN
ncbi:MAG: hypothetical protein D6691_11425 [Candidatus Hydrogenedentota bacterium]|uniref:Uncharacterized protein n=1 Tax=Sumerlaea chitinivorans TaxID=2250252 RepID=A0A2Z4Y7P5_SUMC1|nr:hypothetical protein BRCON_1658 [Candidatus Sumerlaea chitinivorans]RMH24629.1 MAG: hypothetical protein D6691_11425 [Candidatus Hydrogenedentota bacterium]